MLSHLEKHSRDNAPHFLYTRGPTRFVNSGSYRGRLGIQKEIRSISITKQNFLFFFLCNGIIAAYLDVAMGTFWSEHVKMLAG